MAIYTDKRSGRLYIQFDFNGQTYKKRLPADTDNDTAQALEGKMKSDLLLESFGFERKKDVEFSTFLVDYFLPFAETHYSPNGFKDVVTLCKAVLPFLQNISIRKITAADIDRFKIHRQNLKTQHGTTRKPATISRELSVVSKIFNLAIKNEFLEFNPCSRVSRPIINNTENQVIPPNKIQPFLENIKSPVARDVAILILNTGLRQNDALGLKKSEVDFKQKTITLIQGKSKRIVTIPLNDTILEVLEKRKDYHSHLFFPHPKTKQQIKSIKTTLKNAGIRTGLGKVGTRTLRRTFGTFLSEMNFSPSIVAKLLGHSDLRSVSRYQRETDVLRTAVDALNTQKTSIILPTDKNAKRQND